MAESRMSARRASSRCGQQAIHLVQAEKDRQLAAEVRQVDLLGGIAVANALPAQEFEELALRHQGAGLRARREPLRGERGQVVEHVHRAHGAHVLDVAANQKAGQRRQIVAVGRQGRHRQLALDPQMVQELLDGEIDGQAHGADRPAAGKRAQVFARLVCEWLVA
jgi:hypothetical protein